MTGFPTFSQSFGEPTRIEVNLTKYAPFKDVIVNIVFDAEPDVFHPSSHDLGKNKIARNLSLLLLTSEIFPLRAGDPVTQAIDTDDHPH